MICCSLRCDLLPADIAQGQPLTSHCRGAQVLLGDMPANISSRRLGDGVLQSALINMGIVVAAAAATAGAEITHRLPGYSILHLVLYMRALGILVSCKGSLSEFMGYDNQQTLVAYICV